MADYRFLPIPTDYRGPSGEPNQIRVEGRVSKVTLFHGKADEEFDWHIFLDMDGEDTRAIGRSLRQDGVTITDTVVGNLYSELMVIDDWHRRGVTWPPWQASFQRRYDTADLTRPLRLSKSGSEHAAFDLAKPIADEPKKSATDLSEHSRLVSDQAWMYMQGLLVLDIGHSDPSPLEIHPPDSFAYAMDEDGRSLSIRSTDENWPPRTVRWRVGWFSNSSHHRVNDLLPLKQRRTTTWFLALPRLAGSGGFPTDPFPIGNVTVTTESIPLWDSKSKTWYDSRGVVSIDDARIEIDPNDNRRRLRLSATMDVPGRKGGIIVRDYILRLQPDVIKE